MHQWELDRNQVGRIYTHLITRGKMLKNFTKRYRNICVVQKKSLCLWVRRIFRDAPGMSTQFITELPLPNRYVFKHPGNPVYTWNRNSHTPKIRSPSIRKLYRLSEASTSRLVTCDCEFHRVSLYEVMNWCPILYCHMITLASFAKQYTTWIGQTFHWRNIDGYIWLIKSVS